MPNSADKAYYAHSLPNRPQTEWELMSEHEERVAHLCAKFLKRIQPELEPWGDLLGRWHDLGKYSDEFQQYIRSANQQQDVHRAEISTKVDHSSAAAQHANNVLRFGKLLSYCFAGHHAGLPDWDTGVGESGLRHRLRKSIKDWEKNAPNELTKKANINLPAFKQTPNREEGTFRISFLVRILFSALVDADFLATESFMSPERHQSRSQNSPSLSDLAKTLENHLLNLQRNSENTPVNRIRHQVSEQCLKSATLEPGFFSLCVPTGGGKTLASLRFALAHAIENNRKTEFQQSRVIMAVPFTSIIEQNADVYRKIFKEHGPDVVLEHHSNLDPDEETTTNRLQCENWDAPLVVTTNVQFFESLFASRTSRCRKLHRIARSIIVLDEAQALPIELLKPTLFALRELVTSYGCSVVLCSATQPALGWREDFPIGVRDLRPIILQPNRLHESLRRTKVEVAGTLTNDKLLEQLNDLAQVLCIVNTRGEAAEVFEGLNSSDGNYHLSTRMCAAHRLDVLSKIRKRLQEKDEDGNPLTCRVISTQLIEAGVDVDFPVVYRAACGLDSLTQAAGRCNREGGREIGKVVFFETETLPPIGFLRQSSDTAKLMIGKFEDLLAPQTIKEYFERHYYKKKDSWDKNRIFDSLGKNPSDMQWDFREIAKKYRFIPEESETLLVQWDKISQELIDSLIDDPYTPVDMKTWRQLQRYTVQIRRNEFLTLIQAGAIEQHHNCWVLIQKHLYDPKLGLQLNKADGSVPAEDLIF